MRHHYLLTLGLLVGCSDGPSREESGRVLVSATSAMTTAQTNAMATIDANGNVSYSGPCSLGGSISLSGTYTEDAAANVFTFDLQATFAGCREAQGTLDGSLHWTSTNTETNGNSTSTVTMQGDLDWDGQGGAGACEIDLTQTISSTGLSQSGTVCGHSFSQTANW